jgi:hypothetical protein
MTLYAFEAVDDALDATRAFLWPIDRGRWLRLAFVLLFIGSGGFSPFQFPGGSSGGTTPDTSGTVTPPETLPSIGGTELAIIAAIVVIVAVVVLGFMFVGSVMEFVFVQSLRTEAVSVRRYWRDHWRAGLRLFGFRLVVGLVSLGVVGGLLALAIGPAILSGNPLSLGLLIVAIPLIILVSIVVGLLSGFTTMFVVPVMLLEGRGLLTAWRRFWPTLTAEWRQYAVYAVLGFVLQLAGGLLAGIATLVGALVLAIPLGLLGLLGGALLTVVHPVGLVVIAVAVLVFVAAVIVLSLLVSVPVQTYLRYYALFVLGDTNEAFDVIPERRRAVRDDSPDADATA